eukprot:c25591_g2_i1 orf=157-2346(+)
MSSVWEDQICVKCEDVNGPRVKFLCSYGGKIVPKPHDSHLRYVGGETRMVAIRRSTSYSELMTKLCKLFGPDLYFKYQLPNEDLDALISVTCDEDVENMMDEYDKNEIQEGSSRLRAFLFPAAHTFCSRNLEIPRGQEFLDEKSPEQTYVEAVNGFQTILNVHSDSSASGSSFKVPDFLFGLDPANQQHEYHHPPQQDGEMFSPTYVHSPSYREQFFPRDILGQATSVTSFVAAVAVNPQSEFSKIQNPLMDIGKRAPAPASLALDQLLPNSPVNVPMWETEKIWEGQINIEQRGERKERRRSGEITNDAKLQLDPGAESGLPRVSSKDTLAPRRLDVSPDSHPIDRHVNMALKQATQKPSVLHLDKHKLEEIQVDVPAVGQEMRQEGAMGGGMFQRPPDMHHCMQQTNLVQVQDSDGVMERAGSRRNSGDSDQDVHKRMNGQVVVDNSPHANSYTTTDSQTAGFRYQDSHRAEENVLLQQPRQGEFEVCSSLLANQIDHMHLGKGHFQQVYWQGQDLQDQQHLQQVPPHEAIHVHSAPVLQRLLPASNLHLPLSGATVNHHLSPPVSNTFPIGRFPSPLYRQAGTGVALQNDSQQFSRAVGPLHENAPNNGPPLGLRYAAAQIAQMHESRVCHSTNQQLSGIPVPSSYLEFSEPHSIYEQSAGQMQFPEMVMKAASDTGMGQIHYPEKIVKTSHDPPIVQAHFIEEDMNAKLQYSHIASLQNSQGMHS